ncbi:unnamed protein product [Lactuca virosa]|uniref:PUM-HD domain-containing protein n=1 Tax=Lactuca virosa TaxID=75947 RepID=A0AAU9MBE3_9ASTR|nr:unnamed protein product [Lactuca virosa]
MTTESPIRIMDAFGKQSTNMNIEDLGLLLKAQNFQEKQKTSPPNRSGSAPPSMEGSFAAIENFMSRHKISQNMSESEEQLRADPSYIAYYSNHVNLNPRLPPPLISDENRHLFVGNNQRLTSFDDSFRPNQSNLSTHKEESDDDRSPKQEETEETDDHDTGRLLYSNPPPSSINTTSINHSQDNLPNAESQSQRDRRTMFQVYGPGPQHQTYINMNQYLQSPSNSVTSQSPYASGSYMMTANPVYPNMIQSGYFPPQQYVTGYAFNHQPSLSPYVTGYLPTNPVHVPMPFDITASQSFIGQNQSQTSGVNLQHFNKFYGHPGLQIQPPFLESLQISSTHGDDHQIMPKQQSLGLMGHNLNSRRIDTHTMNPYYFGSPTNSGILQFPPSNFASPPVPGSPIGGVGFHGGRNGVRSPSGSYGGHQVFKDPKTYSFLEELKSGKGRRLDLSDIFGHIVEFCGDQHGSRFIQQKLEICSVEEKESVFKEVLPNASSLITDVFGNYVIQKFFEYGSTEQRRELANQLEGQILPLSLQMYGCRVIQKALDVIELEQKIKLVRELDGHVLRCVRDQNGNHVIQKCIESISIEKIKFVISSFRGQVASLSTHPYGCRVIQRVLEHSTDELQSQFIVDEILESVYTLAQDQYGNYVTQHVLKRGKPEERNQIVHKLKGHVVQLSQHKFASNVIEKCLEYGDSATRGVLIEEIIGLGDNNDNLLAMVKDQFANYVIQKVLQTCTPDQHQVLLGRIKIHLNSLKKYTYGKHIVARFEQLYGEEFQVSGS